MTFKTHVVSSLVVGIATAKYLGNYIGLHIHSDLEFSIYLFAVAFGAVFPDIDEPNSYIGRKFGIFSQLFSTFFKHRGITHTAIVILFYLGVLSLFVLAHYSNPLYKIAGIGFIIGNIGHILGDSSTKSGVPLLYPLYNKNFGILPKQFRYTTGGVIEYLFVLPAFSLILAYQLFGILK